MFTSEVRVGRLYEHRLLSIGSEQEAEELGRLGREVMDRAGGRVVVCADFRFVRYIRADLVEPLVRATASVNDRVERSALLVGADRAIFGMQLSRMVRAANLPTRRIFTDPVELQTWLAELLGPAERMRLAQFIAEGEALDRAG